jgi:ribose-phosphate pyrophosphokinase
MKSYGDLKIISGNANPGLAEAICKDLQCPLTPSLTKPFSDGEIRVEVGDNVRGQDVFVIQPTCRWVE